MNSASPLPKTRHEIEIRNWRPYQKKTLRGFFAAVLPSGMILNDLMLHEKEDGTSWVAFPAREYVNQQNLKQYAPHVDFIDKHTRDRFQEQLVEALEKYLTPATKA